MVVRVLPPKLISVFAVPETSIPTASRSIDSVAVADVNTCPEIEYVYKPLHGQQQNSRV